MTGIRQRARDRSRATAITGLLALCVHLSAFALAAVMPVTTALAAAQAQPNQIVICTVHGPITVDAAELGLDGTGEPQRPDLPRTACDLDLQASAAIGIGTQPPLPGISVRYADTHVQRPATDTNPAYAAPLNRASPPRAPPHPS